MRAWLCIVSCLCALGVSSNALFAQSDAQSANNQDNQELPVPPAPAANQADGSELESESNQVEQIVQSVRGQPGQGTNTPQGFERLFNGKNLDGWTMAFDGYHRPWTITAKEFDERESVSLQEMANVWVVHDEIVSSLQGARNLISKQNFHDFEMYVDWKIEPDTNSGIFLRGVPQVQIWDNPLGSGGLSNNTNMFRNPMLNNDNPTGQWNRFHILMVGSVVTVVLNGKLVVNQGVLQNYWNRGDDIPAEGPIELQHDVGTASFKNLFMRRSDHGTGAQEDVTFASGQKAKVSYGGFSLTKVEIKADVPADGKVHLEGVYNEPITVALGEGIHARIVPASSVGNTITMDLPEDYWGKKDVEIILRIVGSLALVPTDDSDQAHSHDQETSK